MYEVTYTIDGNIHKMTTMTNDTNAIFNLLTNQFASGSGGKNRVEIIDMVRK